MSENDPPTLAPPRRTSIADPGAHDLESSDSSDDHFSDAHSGPEQSSGNASPVVPLTRVEKVDNEPSYGEVPGTDAYNKRELDAEPDQIAIVPEGRNHEDVAPLRVSTPGGQPIPTTVVEKIDPSIPSHGEVPGTPAHNKRSADAVPDMVIMAGSISHSAGSRSRAQSTPGDHPIPITRVEKIDSEPSHGEVPGTEAYEMRKRDAEPDIVRQAGDRPGSPTSYGARSPNLNHARRKSSGAGRNAVTDDYNEGLNSDESEDDGFGDDFDDFEEGEVDAEFDDFNDGFKETESVPAQVAPAFHSFPVLDFAEFDSTKSIHIATEPYLDALFPPETIERSILPSSSSDNSVFLSDRSASLWTQLVAPPPLQPPNWIRSRIRRLFLVSLGVPVDLDEILPASKQKKLILPSIHLSPTTGSPRTSTDSRSISRLKQSDANASNTSLDSQGKPSRSDSRRRKVLSPVPQLDLVSARQLCTITDMALDGMTLDELKEHVRKLKFMQLTANDVLEYWTKKTDEKLGDREAFEGVIENLVKHARKVRK